jgi:hypothetical protein
MSGEEPAAPRRLARRASERIPPRAELIEQAAEVSRAGIRTRRERMVVTARPILQTSVAAALAWLIATELVGHAKPFFAPIAAVITLGLTVGQRRRRAVELAIGVSVGIAIADLLVAAIGSGTWQVGVVTGLAMLAATLVDAERALSSVSRLDPAYEELTATLAAAGDAARISLSRRGNLTRLERYVAAVAEIGLAIENTRALARGVIRAIALDDSTPPEVTAAIRELATATRELITAVDEDDPRLSRDAALHAVRLANAVLAETTNLSALHIVGQVRIVAVDILRASGVPRPEAQQAVRTAEAERLDEAP